MQCLLERLHLLQAAAVIDRIRRAIAATSDSVSQRIDPISSAMGRAFRVDSWAVDLFAEEVSPPAPSSSSGCFPHDQPLPDHTLTSADGHSNAPCVAPAQAVVCRWCVEGLPLQSVSSSVPLSLASDRLLSLEHGSSSAPSMPQGGWSWCLACTKFRMR